MDVMAGRLQHHLSSDDILEDEPTWSFTSSQSTTISVDCSSRHDTLFEVCASSPASSPIDHVFPFSFRTGFVLSKADSSDGEPDEPTPLEEQDEHQQHGEEHQEAALPACDNNAMSLLYQEQTITTHPLASTAVVQSDKHVLLAKLNSLTQWTTSQTSDGEMESVITLCGRGRPASTFQPGIGITRSQAGSRRRRIRLHSRSTERERWRHEVASRIIDLIRFALTEGKIITKRDIYYRDPELFEEQSVVDRYVDDIACTLDLTRGQLNVIAAAKGLYSGAVTIRRRNGQSVEGDTSFEGLLIPNMQDVEGTQAGRLKCILIVEKEACFQTLSSPSFHAATDHTCLLVTAKGYPDISTRSFLRSVIRAASPAPRVFALVDYDPDGLGILSTYKHGSVKLAHENINLNIPQIEWLGVRSSCFSDLARAPESTRQERNSGGVQQLTGRDRRKAVRMLEWTVCAEENGEAEWRRELQVMLMLNLKAGIQVLDRRPGDLEEWVLNEIGRVNGDERELLGETDMLEEHNMDTVPLVAAAHTTPALPANVDEWLSSDACLEEVPYEGPVSSREPDEENASDQLEEHEWAAHELRPGSGESCLEPTSTQGAHRSMDEEGIGELPSRETDASTTAQQRSDFTCTGHDWLTSDACLEDHSVPVTLGLWGNESGYGARDDEHPLMDLGNLEEFENNLDCSSDTMIDI